MKFTPHLKSLVIIIIAALSYVSCSKSDTENTKDVVNEFVGNWDVTETSTYWKDGFTEYRFHSNDTFKSKIVNFNPNTVGLVQNARVPVPSWVGAHVSWSQSDTLKFYVNDSTRGVYNINFSLSGSYSIQKDSLKVKFNVMDGSGVVFWVYQDWVRAK